MFGGALGLAGVPLNIAAESLAGKIPYTSKTPLVGDAISYLGKKVRLQHKQQQLL